MTIVDRPPHVQAALMIECHADYDMAIKLASDNVRLYGDPKWDEFHVNWWKAVKEELLRMKRNHNLTDHEYYMEITGELDDAHS